MLMETHDFEWRFSFDSYLLNCFLKFYGSGFKVLCMLARRVQISL